MDFGQAIEALKGGRKVQRSGWNGKGMWLILVQGYSKAHSNIKPLSGSPYSNDSATLMFTSNGEMRPGWLASQSEMLADDWQEVS